VSNEVPPRLDLDLALAFAAAAGLPSRAAVRSPLARQSNFSPWPVRPPAGASPVHHRDRDLNTLTPREDLPLKEPSRLSTTSDLLSVAQVSQRLGVSTRTVRRLIARSELPVHRIGAQLRVSELDLDVFLRLRRSTAAVSQPVQQSPITSTP
jgi:excisionase family DNA binding protein